MRSILFALCLLGFASTVHGDEIVDYARQIKPVLQSRCYACHGVLKQEAGLRLDTAALAIKGADSGSVIKPGDAARSTLLARVSSTDDAERMPPEGEPLKPEEISALRAWIAAGATGSGDEKPERDPRDHWAFQTPVRPQVPEAAWGLETNGNVGRQRAQLVPGRASRGAEANPIDSFIAETHRKLGLKPQPAADKRVWLRRVSLDLIGLPPTKDELDASWLMIQPKPLTRL